MGLAEYGELWYIVTGTIIFMATIKFLRILRFNEHIDQFASTLRVAREELLEFMVVMFLVMMAFGSMAYTAFGVDNMDYCTWGWTLTNLYSMLIGRFVSAEFRGFDRWAEFIGLSLYKKLVLSVYNL